MENVVVIIENNNRTRSRKGSPIASNNSNSPKGSSPPSPVPNQADGIISVCDAPKSPSPKRSIANPGSSSSVFLSSSSYNFSEEQQPLTAPPDPPEHGDSRNRSFNFGVIHPATTTTVHENIKPNNKGYYRLPSPKHDPADTQRSDTIPEIHPEPKTSPSRQLLESSKVSLRTAIARESDSSDDDKGDHATVMNASNSGAPITVSVEAVVVKSPTIFNRLKSRSRLAERPPPLSPPAVSSPAGGYLNVPLSEEEDPLRNVDLPEKYRRLRFGYYSAFQLVALVLLTALLVCSCTMTLLRRRSIWSLELWKWVLMVLVVVSGHLVSGWFMQVLVLLIERNFTWRKRVLYFVYALRRGVQTALWLTLCLISWLLLFDRKIDRSTKNHKALTYVTKGICCFLLGAFIWLAKLLLVKVLASTYHVNTYFDRIQESVFSQYILEKLSGPPLEEIRGGDEPRLRQSVTFKHTNPRRGKENKEEPALSIDKLQQLNQKNVSAWNMKRLVRMVKQSKISTLTQTIGSTSVQENRQENEIHTEWQARAAAKEVFKNVANPGSKKITMDDLLRFLTESEAMKAFALFEGAAETGGAITKKILVNWVVDVYRERRSLALSLNDTKTAVDRLHQIINAMTFIIILIISLLVLGLATSHLVVAVSSQVLLIVFIFGNTCKTIFEAIIFLFVMHPYDVGDRCIIDGVQLVVEEMNILTTVFLRFDNEKIYYPNAVLATKPISNYYRSPDMNDAIDFTVDMSTPVEKLAALREKVARHISSKGAHWHNKSTIVVKEIENMNLMRMALWVTHTMNFQDAGERMIRRSELIIKLKTFCEELSIQYHLLPQEVTLSRQSSSV